MGSDEQDSSGAATDYGAPAGNMSGGQPPSGGGPDYGPPAGNMSGEQPPSGFPGGNMTGERHEITTEAFEAQVAELEALGFDLSEVRAALDAGDQAAAQEAFRAFVMEHRDELPEDVFGPPRAEEA
jgi:hypothetical protein